MRFSQAAKIIRVVWKHLDQLFEGVRHFFRLLEALVEGDEFFKGRRVAGIAFEDGQIFAFRLVKTVHAQVRLCQKVAELDVGGVLLQSSRDVLDQSGKIAHVFVNLDEAQFDVFKQPVAGGDEFQSGFVGGDGFGKPFCLELAVADGAQRPAASVRFLFGKSGDALVDLNGFIPKAVFFVNGAEFDLGEEVVRRLRGNLFPNLDGSFGVSFPQEEVAQDAGDLASFFQVGQVCKRLSEQGNAFLIFALAVVEGAEESVELWRRGELCCGRGGVVRGLSDAFEGFNGFGGFELPGVDLSEEDCGGASGLGVCQTGRELFHPCVDAFPVKIALEDLVKRAFLEWVAFQNLFVAFANLCVPRSGVFRWLCRRRAKKSPRRCERQSNANKMVVCGFHFDNWIYSFDFI